MAAIIYLSPIDIPSPYPYILAGVLLANLSHLLSALVLYSLTELVYPTSPAGGSVAFIASVMHVLSPAGIFLAAPYSESLFALLSFLGYYLYARSMHAYSSSSAALYNGLGLGMEHMGFVMGAGALWMLAGMVRSNGVLNGVVVLTDFVYEGWVLAEGGRKTKMRDGISVMRRLARIAGLGVAGVMVGLGLVVPQGIAWMQFCAGGEEGGRGMGGKREWCSRAVPSIYSYVQDKYWYVGPLYQNQNTYSTEANNFITGTWGFYDTGPQETSHSSYLPRQPCTSSSALAGRCLTIPLLPLRCLNPPSLHPNLPPPQQYLLTISTPPSSEPLLSHNSPLPSSHLHPTMYRLSTASAAGMWCGTGGLHKRYCMPRRGVRRGRWGGG